MIELQHVTKNYGSLPVLADVCLRVGGGEIVALLGTNGAGKSTLMRCLLGIESYGGEIRVGGLDPLRQGKKARSRIGYLPQSCGLDLDLEVGETLDFHSDLRRAPRERARRDLFDVGLSSLAGARVGDLSGGMRQRLALLIALIGDPPVLVADEPSASLDREGHALLLRLLRQSAARGKAILLSTHADAGLLALCDRHLTLVAGRLADSAGSGREPLPAFRLVPATPDTDRRAVGGLSALGGP